MRQLPTGTVTFLFTDIEGSTRKWEQSPHIMRQALARHDVLLQQAVEYHQGHVFKTVGDAFCAVFPNPSEAVAAIIQAHQDLAAQTWDEIGHLRIRVGIHTGKAEHRNNDYFGPTLNRVARLQGIGHGGQTLLSQATADLVRDCLPAGSWLLDLGSHRLKDLGQPEHVWQLCLPTLENQFPPVRSLQAFANNLPLQLTSFVGREQEMAKVKELLSQHHLVTLLGAGGVGKTRLAVQVAADRIEQYGEGVWLVELAALSDPDLVPRAVATVLGVREEPGRSLTETLTEYLRPKKTLLLLDNCEHLIEACASLVQTLLNVCPNVQVLATSREALNISGEQPWRIPSLSQPDPSHLLLEEKEIGAILLGYDAVRLFVDRARTHSPQFVLARGNAEAVAQICQRLDGIPLAIELASARVRALSVEEITHRLDNRFRLLTGGSRTALPRQQTLRALMDWSYDLLTDQEKAFLCRLSVFVGGWTLSAAEAVCVGESVEYFEVLDLLTSLVDKSLVVYEAGEGSVGRYGLLETVRQYARDRLAESGEAESGEAEAVQDRTAAWFLALAEEAEPQLRGPEQAAWLARLETEHDNLRASLSWYEKRTDSMETSLRLTGALGLFWAVRGHYSEGRQWLGRALERTRQREGVADWNASAPRGKTLHEAGTLAYDQGDLEAARTLFEEALTVKRQLEDQCSIAVSLQSLGSVAYNQGNYVMARALLEEALAIHRRQENQQGIAQSLYSLGGVAHNQGHYGVARVLFEESLSIRRQLGDPRGIAISLVGLGSVAARQGDLTAALSFHEEGLALARRLGNLRGIANSLVSLGDVAVQQGDHTGAQALYEESLTLCRHLGHQEGIAYNLEGMAGVARWRSDFTVARGFHEESLTIYSRMGDQEGIASSLAGLAEVAEGQNQSLRAARLWGAASSLRANIGSPLTSAEQEKINQQIGSASTVLGAESFAAAWDAGRAMTLEQAVEYALSIFIIL